MTLKEIIECAKRNNPYPDDIFIPPNNKELEKVAKLLKDNGIIPDRIFAYWGRKVWNNCVDYLEQFELDNF